MNGNQARKSGNRTFRRRCSGSFLPVFVPERVDDRIALAVPAFNLLQVLATWVARFLQTRKRGSSRIYRSTLV